MTMFDTTSASNSAKCARLKGPLLTQDISALIGGLISMSALSGCAAQEKCCFAGCPDDSKITTDVSEQFRQHADLSPPNLLNVHQYRLEDEESMLDVSKVLRAVASAAPRLHSDNRVAWFPDTASSA